MCFILTASLSAPHMHAHCLEALKDHLKPGNKVLDIGSGSGILTACMAEMVGPKGMVVGMDHFEGLVDMSVENIKREGKQSYLTSGRVKMVVGDGREGYDKLAPTTPSTWGRRPPCCPRRWWTSWPPGAGLSSRWGWKGIFKPWARSTRPRTGGWRSGSWWGSGMSPSQAGSSRASRLNIFL